MNDDKDLEKTLADNLESELDKTLDKTVAVGLEIGATIKVEDAGLEETLAGVTLVDNSDNSQTITIQKQTLTYQKETVFDDSFGKTLSQGDPQATIVVPVEDNDKTIIQDEIEKTVVMPMQDNNTTLAMPAQNNDKTIVEDNDKTVVEPRSDKTVAMPSMNADKTVSETDGGQDTVGATAASKSGSQNFFATGSSASQSGGSVTFGGGSLSVNVRPRNVAATLGEGGDQNSDAAIAGREFSDFEILDKLGEGGMGVVYSARQSSIDRSIALKMIKSTSASEAAKSKFLIEAVVTGDLDHPNIVPVHDLGVDGTGNIFYAMKQVAGVEWSSAIKEKSKQENIEILLRVCDAIAFSHDRGVIHRDLKPENVMLGAFGEVLVMDWGLALSVNDSAKAEAIGPHLGIAGTPAYLAPEMARAGAWKMLGCCSDIYLLGAILFEIITGKRPHTGKNVRKCLLNAANNVIREVEETGELLDIAYHAMATNPADRYGSVKDFQKAIRNYLSHSESITLSDIAMQDLDVAEKSGDYDDYAKALFGFRQAAELWSGNSSATQGVVVAGVKYAQAALKKGDLDLGLSLVTEAEEFSEVRSKLVTAKNDREKHAKRLRLLTQGVAVLGVAVLIISLVAAIWISREREEAIEQREEAIKQEQIAVEQKKEAVKQEQIAIEQRKEAVKQEQIAIEQKKEAVKQEQIAVEQREEARKQTIIAKEQTVIAEEQREEALKQEKIANEKKLLAEAETRRANEQTEIAETQKLEARKQAAIAREQEEIATEKKLLAIAESKRANEQAKIAEEQRKIAKVQEQIAIEKKAFAEEETKRANLQTEIAIKSQALAESEKVKAQESEEKAIVAIGNMVTAQTAEQMEKAKREAAELTTMVTQEELSSRDELKNNDWWAFDGEQAKKMQADAAQSIGLTVEKSVAVGDAEIDFKLIPAGIYGMGTRVDEIGRGSEEYLHRVEISKPFYISETELTIKQLIAITGVKMDGEGNYPAWNVSYNEVNNNIIPAIQAQLPVGWKIALPTEAEWEWAARAGTNTSYYSGSDKEGLLGIGYTGAELLTSAKAVAGLLPNAWGIYDMIGNVAEWCEDTYVRDGYITDDKISVDPVVTSGTGKHYVVRGGAWSNLPEHCRAGYRSYANKDSQYNFLGVRLVLTPPSE